MICVQVDRGYHQIHRPKPRLDSRAVSARLARMKTPVLRIDRVKDTLFATIKVYDGWTVGDYTLGRQQITIHGIRYLIFPQDQMSLMRRLKDLALQQRAIADSILYQEENKIVLGDFDGQEEEEEEEEFDEDDHKRTRWAKSLATIAEPSPEKVEEEEGASESE